MQVRLQKILSSAGVASRRAAETMIVEGRVTVNGETVTELGTKADPDRDDVRVDGRRVRIDTHRRYILMYKPRGYITSRSDPQQRPTVIDLLAKGGVKDYVYPVGRLDYDSEGLLLLTSDGDLAAKLTHPRHGIAREYQVRVRGVPDRHTLERLSRGIVIEGRRTEPARVSIDRILDTGHGAEAVLAFVIHEGRNRQVRNMCDAVGHPVVRLRRVRIGPVVDDRIRPGEFRDLLPDEVALLRKAAAGPSTRVARSGQAEAREAGTGKREASRLRSDQPRSERASRARARSAGGRPRRG